VAKRNEPKSVRLPDSLEKQIAVVLAKTDLSFNDLCIVGLRLALPIAENDSRTIKHILVE